MGGGQATPVTQFAGGIQYFKKNKYYYLINSFIKELKQTMQEFHSWTAKAETVPHSILIQQRLGHGSRG
jgi:beta-xylosidase